ncbi:AraC family transcriptional regulator [Paenirhodobacter sp.]|uniref:AraC family transcriptional regulator n=1 Tax=Paenirhodobacter sp. TaxID=1965326 RepID=UPI003B3C5419
MKLFSTPPLSQYAPEAARARILPVTRLAQGGRWRVEAMRALPEPCLLWFTRGQGRITLGGLTRGYGAHNAVFIPAGVMHGFEVGPQTQGAAVFFGRDGDILLPGTALHLRIRESGPQIELSALIEAASRELESKKPGADRAAQMHLGLIGVWLERQGAVTVNEAQPSDAARKLAARYVDLLERDFRTGLGIADFAAVLGVTPTHLSRVCRQTCARSAHDLLQDRRLYEARRLLADTQAPVKDISNRLGFTSPAYFTRAFHLKTGKTPSAFRKAD